jgi:hypothetical protein
MMTDEDRQESGVDELARGILWFVRRLWWVAMIFIVLLFVAGLVEHFK